MASLEQLLNESRTAGITIWVRDSKVQVNVRGEETDGWSVTVGTEIAATLREALERRASVIGASLPEVSFLDEVSFL